MGVIKTSSKQSGRLTVTKVVGNVSCYDFEGSVTRTIDLLQNLIRGHGENVSLDYGQHDMYDDRYSYNICVTREETDEEYAARMAERKALTKLQEKREREEYERLAKKFAKCKESLTNKE